MSGTTPSRSQSSMHLLNLPNEILTHVFSFLDNRPPSSTKELSKPDHDLTVATHRPLKHISLTQSHLRSLVLPLLFRHARLDPYHLSSFLAFLAKSSVIRHVETITAQLQGPCNHIHPAWWAELVDQIPGLATLTILAAPHVFAEIGQVPIETSHSWAFKIPYQTMTISYTPFSAQQADTLGIIEDEAHVGDAERCLLTSRRWRSLSINESSHLPAYSSYEYFLKVPPSLLTSLYHRQHPQLRSRSRLQPSVEPYLLPSTTSFYNNLTSFSYTAIFPFYNHVDEILKCIRQLKSLRKLFMKLCPEPESNVLQDELERNGDSAGRTEGRIDVNDPWNEFETSYALIPHTIIYLTTDGSLEEFQTDDVKMIGIRDSIIKGIDRRLGGLGCWSHAGQGIWKRDMKVRIGSKDEQDRSENV